MNKNTGMQQIAQPFTNHAWRPMGVTAIKSLIPEASLIASLLWASLFMIGVADARAEGDIEQGKRVFRLCIACHKIGPGARNLSGPKLNGIVGRKAGTVEGFKYSPANKKAGEQGWIWTEQALDKYLENPRKAMPGNRMVFIGIKSAKDRKNLIAYLKSFKSSQHRGTTKTMDAASAPVQPGAKTKRSAKAERGGKSQPKRTTSVIWVGGSTPSKRPPAAPRLRSFEKTPAWYRRALAGLSKPYPPSFRFLEDQGAWYTPFNSSGMTSPYDLRAWHKS